MGMRTVAASGLGIRAGAALAFRGRAFPFRLGIISSVKPLPFKDHAAASSDKPAYFLMALGAFSKRLIRYLLKYVK